MHFFFEIGLFQGVKRLSIENEGGAYSSSIKDVGGSSGSKDTGEQSYRGVCLGSVGEDAETSMCVMLFRTG